MVFALKMFLDNTYRLPNLFEFKSYHFSSLFQAECEFKNSNFGGKYIDGFEIELPLAALSYLSSD